MEKEDAEQLARDLESLEEVNYAYVIVWETSVASKPLDKVDSTEYSDFHVEFHAYDALIPASVVNEISNAPEELGIYAKADSFATAPKN